MFGTPEKRRKAPLTLQDERHRKLHQVPGLGLILDVYSKNELCFISMVTTESSIFLVREGTMTVEAEGTALAARQGEFLLLQAGVPLKVTHLPSDDGEHRASGLLLDRTMVAESVPTPSAVFREKALLLGKRDERFLDSFLSAYRALLEADSMPHAIVAHRLREVLTWLALESLFFRPAECVSLTSRLRRLLSASPGDNWPEERAGRELGQSPATMRRHLAAEKTSFREVLSETRMIHALRLLHSSDDSIGEIARSAGYACQSRFAQRFRDRFGFLPSIVRGHRRK